METDVKETKESKSAQTYWDQNAKVWTNATVGENSYYVTRAHLVADRLKTLVLSGSVLDVGCASGVLCRVLFDRGYDVFGTDISPEMIKQAIERLAPVLPDADARFRPCTAAELPFAREFDALAVMGVFPYIDDYVAYARRLSRYLKPGGILIASNTIRFSVYTALATKEHFKRFQWTREWRQTFVNLLRTGIQSGGCKKYDPSRQFYGTKSFDRAIEKAGFVHLSSIDHFNVPRLDARRERLFANPLTRFFASKVVRGHVAFFRKTA